MTASMLMTIEDDVLGKRTLNMLDQVALIEDQLKYLKALQVRGNKTPALVNDIQFYEWLLGQENCAIVIGEYLMGKGKLAERGFDGYNFEFADELGLLWRSNF